MKNLNTFDAASDALLTCLGTNFKPIKRHISDEKSDMFLVLFCFSRHVRTASLKRF